MTSSPIQLLQFQGACLPAGTASAGVARCQSMRWRPVSTALLAPCVHCSLACSRCTLGFVSSSQGGSCCCWHVQSQLAQVCGPIDSASGTFGMQV